MHFVVITAVKYYIPLLSYNVQNGMGLTTKALTIDVQLQHSEIKSQKTYGMSQLMACQDVTFTGFPEFLFFMEKHLETSSNKIRAHLQISHHCRPLSL